MTRAVPIVLMLLFAACMCMAAEDDAVAPRLANGRVIPGNVIKAAEEGLEIETPRGNRTYAWYKLSLATRFRYEPGFRERLDAILKGEAASQP